MRKPIIAPTIAATLMLSLAACGNRGAYLDPSHVGLDGPDEFAVMPLRPLELPANLALPQPTPGAANRTDPNPTADAIAALGGSPAAAFAGGIPAADSALIAAVSRNGVAPDIRATLAAEDADFRGGRFGLLRRDNYFARYAGQALDAYGELDRFRNLGIAVPSAPPSE